MSSKPGEDEGGLHLDVVGRADQGHLRLTGHLDAATAQAAFDVAREMVRCGATALTLDCAELQFCDSAGLRVLVLLSREVDGRVTLHRPNPALVRLLEVTDLLPAFTLT